ncbi:MAG: hypothetical protein V4447_10560 [Pseudomonadota bacterium]
MIISQDRIRQQVQSYMEQGASHQAACSKTADLFFMKLADVMEICNVMKIS